MAKGALRKGRYEAACSPRERAMTVGSGAYLFQSSNPRPGAGYELRLTRQQDEMRRRTAVQDLRFA